jgi:zinc protease
MYGSHPYGKTASPESVAAITADDLAEFHATYWRPSRMRITIVGALTEPQAREFVSQLLAHTAQEAAPSHRPIAQQPAPTPAARGSRQAIAHPASQSHIWIGMPALGREDPDFFAMTVGNYIFGGGGFVSRLTEEIREKRGLSYSVFSGFSPLAQPGPFLIGLQTQTAKAPEALKVVEDSLNAFLKNGPTDKELKAAKQNLIGGFALRVDTNRKLLDNLAQINYYDLPLDYLQTWTKKIGAVTTADIRRVMNRVIQPSQLSVVVVAGPADFKP